MINVTEKTRGRREEVWRKLQQMVKASKVVDLEVRRIGNGLAYAVTLPKPEQLEQLELTYTAPAFARAVVYLHVGPPDGTWHIAQDREAGDGVILKDVDTILDRKWRRIWASKG